MNLIVTSREEAARLAAEQYAVLLSQKPKSTLGFATGSTPLALYAELARAYQRKELSFSQATSFNLDEYVGLEETNPQSYRYFMNQNLFSKIDLPLERTHVPSGKTASAAEADEYESLIQAAGGIDLQLLGIGQNGHIGLTNRARRLVRLRIWFTSPKAPAGQTRGSLRRWTKYRRTR